MPKKIPFVVLPEKDDIDPTTLPNGKYACVNANTDDLVEEYPWHVELFGVKEGKIVWPGSCNSIWVIGKYESEVDKVYVNPMPDERLAKLKQDLLSENDVELVPEQVAA